MDAQASGRASRSYVWRVLDTNWCRDHVNGKAIMNSSSSTSLRSWKGAGDGSYNNSFKFERSVLAGYASTSSSTRGQYTTFTVTRLTGKWSMKSLTSGFTFDGRLRSSTTTTTRTGRNGFVFHRRLRPPIEPQQQNGTDWAILKGDEQRRHREDSGVCRENLNAHGPCANIHHIR